MDIVNVNFEEKITIKIAGEIISLVAFKTLEHGNIKFGLDAPRSIKVHREEIYHALKLKEEPLDAE